MTPEYAVGPGDTVDLLPGDREWSHQPLRLQITAIRRDLSQYYDDQVWIEGYELDAYGQRLRWTQELVNISALNR
jgi:hypothetical protein